MPPPGCPAGAWTTSRSATGPGRPPGRPAGALSSGRIQRRRAPSGARRTFRRERRRLIVVNQLLVPSVGLGVLHLFCKLGDPASGRSGQACDASAVIHAVKHAEADDVQVVSVAMLGHKSDLCFMALGADMWRLRRFQSDLQAAGLDVVNSYVSLTEVSEYAAGIPEEMKQARLYP